MTPPPEFVEQQATLPAQPGSVGAARRFVRNALDAVAAAADLVDDVLLTTSELVANAVLHAGGPVVLRVRIVTAPELVVRLEVGDPSPVPPAVRDYDAGASTGRGLGLVARLAARWGVEHGGGDGTGKVVWVDLAPRTSSGGVALAELELNAQVATPAPDAVAVVFRDVPIDAYLRLQEQNDGVMRELELLAFTADLPGEVDPSPELAGVIEQSRRYFNVQREGFRGEVAAAAQAGLERLDLVGLYSPSAVEPAADYVDLFERAEDLAEDGQMLIGPADAVVAKLRRWFIAEMSRQLLEGAEPSPFDPDDDLQLPRP